MTEIGFSMFAEITPSGNLSIEDRSGSADYLRSVIVQREDLPNLLRVISGDTIHDGSVEMPAVATDAVEEAPAELGGEGG